jgi:hypothetical protein
MGGKSTGLTQHRVNQSGLAVVYVRDNRDITKKVIGGHGKSLPSGLFEQKASLGVGGSGNVL